jgi:CubicO group peptidase (beta-lactamase class C family)
MLTGTAGVRQGHEPTDPEGPMTVNEALEAAVARIDGWDVPAAAVAVAGRDGILATRGDTERVLPVASLAKPLTATTVLLEVAAGRLDLDEPVGPTAQRGGTLRHLLAHAAGLGFEAGDRTMEPGTRRIYSNWGYELAAAHASERAGAPFSELMQERLTGPLGMTSTTLDGSPAHAVTSTVDDLVRFASELLVPTVLDTTTHELLTGGPAFPGLDGVLPGFGRQRPNGWSLGLEVKGAKDPHWSGARLSPATVGHFGRTGSLLWADPVHGLALASLSGRDFDDWARTAWPALNDAIIDARAAGGAL